MYVDLKYSCSCVSTRNKSINAQINTNKLKLILSSILLGIADMYT